MSLEMTKDELVNFFYSWAAQKYGPGVIRKSDLRKVRSRKLYGAWRRVVHYPYDEIVYIIERMVRDKGLDPKKLAEQLHVSKIPRQLGFDFKKAAANDRS